ncbi:hypothetical protein [Niabella sp.]|uniref:hypothetical protein n=1 Tax=Niabella sp. TaxID=1962976 RepID=UPI002620ACB4|nr:hypothetical protein [Niabella sp.]
MRTIKEEINRVYSDYSDMNDNAFVNDFYWSDKSIKQQAAHGYPVTGLQRGLQ